MLTKVESPLNKRQKIGTQIMKGKLYCKRKINEQHKLEIQSKSNEVSNFYKKNGDYIYFEIHSS